MTDYTGLPDSETALLLQAVAASGLPALHTLPPGEARAAYAQRVQRTNLPPGPVDRAEDFFIPARSGDKLHLRVYTPEATADRPLMLFFHGGGFVIGSIETHDSICRHIAAGSGWTVVSVDYRLAPEHRYPAAVHDALDAFDWVWSHADALHADRSRITVAGDSAGATLAAVVAQRAHQQGRQLAHQVLIYPALDQGGAYASRTLFADKFLLTREAIDWFAQHYYGHDRAELDPMASPARAASLAGVAPASIVTAELDPLRDEAAHYAKLLQAAGVKTQYRCIPGVLHGFLGMARYVSAGRQALDELAAFLRSTTQHERNL